MTDATDSSSEGASSEGADRTSTSLLARALNHEQEAWQRLVALYSPLVYQWCRKWGVTPEDAENVGQEVFVAMSKSLPDFRRRRPDDSFRGWIRGITRHKFLDLLRAKRKGGEATGGSDARRRFEQLPAPPEDDCDPESVSRERAALYRRAVELIRAEFSERDWQAFVRVVVEDLPPADVASELSISKNMVYLAKSRILKRLHDEFAEVLDHEPVDPLKS